MQAKGARSLRNGPSSRAARGGSHAGGPSNRRRSFARRRPAYERRSSVMPTPSAATSRPRRCSRKWGLRRTTRPRSTDAVRAVQAIREAEPDRPAAKARSSPTASPGRWPGDPGRRLSGLPRHQARRVRGHRDPRGTGARRRGVTRSSLPPFREELAPHRRARQAKARAVAVRAFKPQGRREARRQPGTCSKTGWCRPSHVDT